MKNSIKFFLIIAIIFLSSVYFLSTIVAYERQVKDLQEQVDILYEDLEFNNVYCDSITKALDSLEIRYQIFDIEPARDLIDIINAIIEVESNGNQNAYNKEEDAVGCLQIRQTMVNDINRILARQGLDIRYTYDCRWDKNKSIEMFNIYCDYYGFDTAEDMARGWNGGPRGINKSSTIKYWEKVKEEINI